MELKLDLIGSFLNVHSDKHLDPDISYNDSERWKSHAILIGKNNHSMMRIIELLQDFKPDFPDHNQYQEILALAMSRLNNENEWQLFNNYIESSYKDFHNAVARKHPEISFHDLRLISLIKIKLSSTEISYALNISPRGVKKARYRLRKKKACRAQTLSKPSFFPFNV